MDTTYQIISALVGVGIVIMIAPRILARNRGQILRNTAIWVGIFLVLALAYQTIGPHNAERQELSASSTPQAGQPQEGPDGDDPARTLPDGGSNLKEEDGFSPPSEE